MQSEITKLTETLNEIMPNQNCDTIQSNCEERIDSMRELTLGYLDLMRSLNADLEANNYMLKLSDDYENYAQDIITDIKVLNEGLQEQTFGIASE